MSAGRVVVGDPVVANERPDNEPRDPGEEILRTSMALRILRISRATLDRDRQAGRITAIVYGRNQVGYRRRDVERLRAEREGSNATPSLF